MTSARASVLRHRDFRLLYTGQTVSVVGDGIFWIAMAFAVLEITGSKAAIGIVLAAGSVPLLVFLLIGGVIADRFPRKTIMLATDVVRFATQLAIAAILITGVAEVWHLAALNAVYGSALAFFQPAYPGLVQQIMPSEQLTQANGLWGSTRSTALVAGSAIGGFLVDWTGAGTAIALDASTFAVSAMCLALLRPAPAQPAERSSFTDELREGWREVRSHRWVWQMLIVGFLYLLLFVGPLDVVGPIVSKELFGGALAWGLISGTYFGGMILGGLIAMRDRLRRPSPIGGALVLAGALGPFLAALGAPLPVVLVGFLIGGVGIGISATTWTTGLQRGIAADKISRVSAWDYLVSFAGMPIALAATGPVVQQIGSKATLTIMGIGVVVTQLFVLASPDIRAIGAKPALPADPVNVLDAESKLTRASAEEPV